MLEHRSRTVRFTVALAAALALCFVLAPILRGMLPSPTWQIVTLVVAILVPKLSIGRN